MKIVHLCLSNFYIDNFGYQENILPKYNKDDGHEVTIIASRFTYQKGKPGLADVGEYINADGIKAVSYTHLDVYKRQLQSRRHWIILMGKVKRPGKICCLNMARKLGPGF